MRIRVRVPQRYYATVTAANYAARLDLSQIQSTGEQTLKISASSANNSLYGSVTEVYNCEVTVQVETSDDSNHLSLEGYKIVRAQFFTTERAPTLTISRGRLKFNTACLRSFEDVEYVELLLNTVENCIAIRPCDASNPNAIRWGKLQNER